MSTTLSNLLQSLRLVPKLDKLTEKATTTTTTTLRYGELPEYSLAEVAQHDTQDDCWLIIYDRVYNVTRFLGAHPGGMDILLEHAGRDATIAFRGTGHSDEAVAQLREFLIGELPPKERIFRTLSHRVFALDVPE